MTCVQVEKEGSSTIVFQPQPFGEARCRCKDGSHDSKGLHSSMGVLSSRHQLAVLLAMLVRMPFQAWQGRCLKIKVMWPAVRRHKNSTVFLRFLQVQDVCSSSEPSLAFQATGCITDLTSGERQWSDGPQR